MPDPSVLRSRAEMAASVGVAGSRRKQASTSDEQASVAFLSALAPILVDSEGEHEFPGALREDHAKAIWQWLTRDAAPDETARFGELISGGKLPTQALDAVAADLTAKVDTVIEASDDREARRKIGVQIGGEEIQDRLPLVIRAIRSRNLLDKAGEFGRATGGMADEATLALALKSMPLDEPEIMPLLMQSAIAQSASPGKLMAAAVKLADSSGEAAIRRSGFGPLVDAMLAHAQNQISMVVRESEAYTDTDLTCRAIDRFHRLMRAISNYVEFSRGSDWSRIASDLTKGLSSRIEPRLRTIAPDLSQSLRRARGGEDVLDSDKLLSALNGIYLLATVRECRESLAVNALYDQVWTESGQLLEALVNRNLEHFRDDPDDEIVATRLETGIKMAEVRFNGAYADILRRARDSVSGRVPPQVAVKAG